MKLKIEHLQLLNDAFSYQKTLKTAVGKDFLNLQSYLTITSKQITSFFYNTSVTPHQVILLSLLFGLTASVLIIQDNKVLVVIGAVLLFYKNVLDKVDGSLARAKGLDSRRGRFYDSLSDFFVSLALFIAISISLYNFYNTFIVFIFCFLAFICSMIQCTYFIYYQVSLIKLSGKSTVNRLLETVTEEDLKTQDRFTLLLQRVFQLIYGWQDYLVYKADIWQLYKLRNKYKDAEESNILDMWYYNKNFLTLSSLLSVGSHMFFIALFAVIGDFIAYLVLNLVLWNLLLFSCIVYHYFSTKYKIVSAIK